ncbi:MAG TPA: hypothetical protein DCY20_02455 [Firmicutes bacterium]|nr:hypothetical protein [Bacillota bacterium]
MIMMMSPAKTFRNEKIKKKIVHTPTRFNEKTTVLLDHLKQYSSEELCQLMKMSTGLGEQNFERYQNFNKLETMTGLYAFDGEAYKGLDSPTLSDAAVSFSTRHFIMLCGLYGIIEPMMEIRPYRLEMATKLPVGQTKDLVQFWKPDLTQYILKALHETSGDQVLLNIASTEYSKALDLKTIHHQFRVVTIEFKEAKGDTYKVVGMYAKKARGQLVRYILENQIDVVEEIKFFNEDGYLYNENLSKEDIWVFTR